ncbi:hypothetical protein ACTFIW_008792 [Dictyostelium discoideum]
MFASVLFQQIWKKCLKKKVNLIGEHSRILQCKSQPLQPSFRDESQIIVQSYQELRLVTKEGSIQSHSTSICSSSYHYTWCTYTIELPLHKVDDLQRGECLIGDNFDITTIKALKETFDFPNISALVHNLSPYAKYKGTSDANKESEYLSKIRVLTSEAFP